MREAKIVSETLHQRIKMAIQNPEPYSTEYNSDGAMTQHYFPKVREICEPPIKIYPLKHQYISDKIWGRRLNEFFSNPDSAMFIDAQTGSGKTHFIFNELYPRLHELYSQPQYSHLQNGMRILMFVSRAPLKQQVKFDAINAAGTSQKEYLTAKGISMEHNFGDIDIYTYQDMVIERNRRDLTNAFKSHKYSVVIFDECHYFLSDADFNPFTEDHFDLLLNTAISTHVSRIYMTSTPEYVLDVIFAKEASLLNYQAYTPTWVYNKISPYPLQYYYFERDYSYFKIHFFDEDDVMRIIKNIPEHNVLIFVESKSWGQSLINELKNNGIDSCFLLDADSLRSGCEKAESVKNALADTNELGVRVLLATKCLDVGVTIKTKNLTIFCFLKDKVDFLQAIGRKRISGSEKVNLYIPVYTGRDIDNYIKKLSRSYADQSEAQTRYPDGATAFGSSFPNPIYVANGVYHHNSFSLRKLDLQLKELYSLQAKLKACDKNETAEIEVISKHILSWMELEDTFSSDMINSCKYVNTDKEDVHDQIMTVINKYKNHALSKEQFQCLCNDLDALGLDPRKDKRPDRKDWSTQTVNSVLKSKNINYSIHANTNGDGKFILREA